MPDVFLPHKRSQIMRAVRSRDTTPELIVRRIAWRLGYHYRLCVSGLPGRPDLVFTHQRKVIFIHGCFWHLHRCRRGNRIPKSRRHYWVTKLARNKARDLVNRQALRRGGWEVMIIWECQTTQEDRLISLISTFLGQ